MKNFSRTRVGTWPLALAIFHMVAMAAPPIDFDAHFSPAFLAQSRLLLKSNGHAGTLNIEMGKANALVPVRAEVIEAFSREVQQMNLKPAAYELGLDGCDVTLRLSVKGEERFSSHVWSPTKRSAPAEDALLRALYAVVDQSPVPSPQLEYLEFLFSYMDGIQPFWKKTAVQQGVEVVRLRGSMSADDIPAFRALVKTLPADRATTFDVTNLGSTGTLFHDEILRASKQRRIQWRAREQWTKLLLQIGIPTDAIDQVKG
jgi:hypothetical protein